MIADRTDVVWVKADDDRYEPFDGARLARSIQRAADAAGQADSVLAEGVAAAMQSYAIECRAGQPIAVGELTRIIGELLSMLGFPEIARAYVRQTQRTEVRLDHMVAAADTSFELGFFHRLDAALDVIADEQLSAMQLRGLRACVMRLRGARRWNQRCRQLAEDIVNHVRHRAARVRPRRAVALRLAMLD